MATRGNSSEVVAAQDLPAPPLVLRSMKPLFYAGIGVAFGTLTGLAITMIGSQLSLPSVFPAATSVNRSGLVTESRNNHLTAASADIRPATVVRVSETTPRAAAPSAITATSSEITPSLASAENHSKCVIRGNCRMTIRIPSSKAPVMEPAPGKLRQPHSLIHPFARQVRPAMASVQGTEMDWVDDQPNQDEAQNQPQVFTEGDLTVEDYDPAGGTIETSDGRTFVVGATVSVSTAASWEDYRASVHYRCSGDGSCTLQRAGAIALDARVI
jgi:hypothetical protein